jgi:hypothetical protein
MFIKSQERKREKDVDCKKALAADAAARPRDKNTTQGEKTYTLAGWVFCTRT